MTDPKKLAEEIAAALGETDLLYPSGKDSDLVLVLLPLLERAREEWVRGPCPHCAAWCCDRRAPVAQEEKH